MSVGFDKGAAATLEGRHEMCGAAASAPVTLKLSARGDAKASHYVCGEDVGVMRGFSLARDARSAWL